MPVDVLYVHQDGLVTGSAISLRNILMALDRNVYCPRVMLASEGPARQLYEALGVPVDVVPVRPFWTTPGFHWYELSHYYNLLALLPNQPLLAYLRRQFPDLVHINDKAMLTAGLACAQAKLPVVWHLRSSYHISHSQCQAKISKAIIRRVAKRLIAISEDEVNGFEDLDNLRVIHNSVNFDEVQQAIFKREDVRAEFGLENDDVAIGMFGGLSEIRGAWDFIQMAGIACANLPGVKMRFFIVAGIPSRGRRKLGWRQRLGFIDSTHPEDKARELAREASVSDRLTLTGYRNDPLAVMSAMDIVVQCAHHGVFGRPPFEAMSVGRPVVAYAGHSQRSQVVKEGETALVVPQKDTRSLASAVIRLVSNPELRRQMGECGQAYSRLHFDAQRNARAVERVYQEVLTKMPVSNGKK